MILGSTYAYAGMADEGLHHLARSQVAEISNRHATACNFKIRVLRKSVGPSEAGAGQKLMVFTSHKEVV